jgi:hypothetical protein
MVNYKFSQETKKEISPKEYLKAFESKGIDDKIKKQLALDRAWKNRDFEIDKYWSRATYFWAFIAATFTGYLVLANTNNASHNSSLELQDLQFVISSLGLIFSFAWCLVNIGSKKWQENWEKHIDLLEDDITGPIYKTVLNEKGYSVSKINLLVSEFVFIIWIILWFRSLFPVEAIHSVLIFSFPKLLISIVSVIFMIIMSTKNDSIIKTRTTFIFRRRYNMN